MDETPPTPANKTEPTESGGRSDVAHRAPRADNGTPKAANAPAAHEHPAADTDAIADANKLTPEEQMARFEKELKENDWGHQPC